MAEIMTKEGLLFAKGGMAGPGRPKNAINRNRLVSDVLNKLDWRKRLFDLASRLRRVCLAIDVVSFLSQWILRRSGRHSDDYIRAALKIVLNWVAESFQYNHQNLSDIRHLGTSLSTLPYLHHPGIFSRHRLIV